MSEPTAIEEWWVYRGTGEPHDGITRLPEAPPWRTPRHIGLPLDNPPRPDGPKHTFQATVEVVRRVNTALYLRRPLLVTGKPGTGKSSLARAVAHELGLGEPLYWPISTRTTLADGLYRYDAIGRLQEAARRRGDGMEAADADPPVTDFLRLGPLGTALAPWRYPRVLLIDEIDKGDVDLPNDLLHVLEEGRFEIPELSRLGGSGGERPYEVRSHDGGKAVPVSPDGWVRCNAFPFIVLTSNGEREFPPAFLRRCVRLDMGEPEPERLAAIVRAHLGEEAALKAEPLIAEFLKRRETETLATDQLLNAVYLATTGPGKDMDSLREVLFKGLGGSGGA